MSKCNVCGITGEFGCELIDDLRAHVKSNWHTFNLKRKVAGLPPLPHALWEQKTAAAAKAQSEADAKLKKAAEKRARNRGEHLAKKAEEAELKEEVPKEPEEPWTECHCLFDNRTFDTFEENLEYMRRKYSFYIHDPEYCLDQKGLVRYLGEKIQRGHCCIYCHKTFPSLQACWNHMKDKGHSRLATDDESEMEIEDFYDFSSSMMELVRKTGRVMKRRPKTIIEEEETDEGSEEDEEESDEDGDEDSEEESDEDSELEIVECEDEDEFADVLAEYGLRRMEVLPSGDLQLPT
jgi:hypothetical protein